MILEVIARMTRDDEMGSIIFQRLYWDVKGAKENWCTRFLLLSNYKQNNAAFEGWIMYDEQFPELYL